MRYVEAAGRVSIKRASIQRVIRYRRVLNHLVERCRTL